MEVYTVEISDDGTQRWKNSKGELHRVGGPAWISGDYQAWYLEGKRLTKEEFTNRTTKVKVSIDGKSIEIDRDQFEKIKELFGD